MTYKMKMKVGGGKESGERTTSTKPKPKLYVREEAESGVWLTCLLPLSVAFGAWRFSDSISYLYATSGVVAVGLLGTTIIYVNPINNSLLFFIPPISTLLGLFYINREHMNSLGGLSTWPKSECALSRDAELLTGHLASLTGGIISSYPVLKVPELLEVAPGCFSFGEAIVIIQAFSLFIHGAVVNITRVAFSHLYLADDTHEDQTATTILQVGLLGIAVVVALLVSIPSLRKSTSFYALLISAAVAIVISLHFLLKGSPFLWILNLVLKDSAIVVLVIYWVLCSLAAVFAVWFQLKDGKRASTVVRKVFHILALLVYLPGILIAPTLLYLASGIVLGIFILLETIRLAKIPPLGSFLQDAFASYADEKDVLIALTPIYLLCGCSLPLWLFPGSFSSPSLILVSGLLSVGLGDTAASVVGSKLGRFHWSESPKTVEGTIACFISQMAAVYLLIKTGFIVESGAYLIQVTIAIAFVSIIETFTDQVDNLVMPLCAYLTFI